MGIWHDLLVKALSSNVKKLYCSFIKIQLGYIWSITYSSGHDVKALERMLKRFTRIRGMYYNERLDKLGLFSLE